MVPGPNFSVHFVLKESQSSVFFPWGCSPGSGGSRWLLVVGPYKGHIGVALRSKVPNHGAFKVAILGIVTMVLGRCLIVDLLAPGCCIGVPFLGVRP